MRPKESSGTPMNYSGHGSIEHFVHGTLGCRCPEEVFRSVVISQLPAVAGRPAVAQLLVGSRLLIHVVAPPAGKARDWIEQLASRGRAARDRHGYTRFRLVVASREPVASAGELAEHFARAVVGDERAHLHFVATDQLPAGLEPPDEGVQLRREGSRTVAK
jgi:hypothetical protein